MIRDTKSSVAVRNAAQLTAQRDASCAPTALAARAAAASIAQSAERNKRRVALCSTLSFKRLVLRTVQFKTLPATTEKQ